MRGVWSPVGRDLWGGVCGRGLWEGSVGDFMSLQGGC